MDHETMRDFQRREEGLPPAGLVFIPGEDFDPSDPDEVEIVKLAMERDMGDRMTRLEEENRLLRMDNQQLRDQLDGQDS